MFGYLQLDFAQKIIANSRILLSEVYPGCGTCGNTATNVAVPHPQFNSFTLVALFCTHKNVSRVALSKLSGYASDCY